MPQLLVLILVNVLAVFLIYFFFKKKFENLLKADSLLARVRDEIQGLIVELNNTTERNLNLTEERITRLTDLLEKADKTIVLLQREEKKTEKTESTYASIKPKKVVVEQKIPEEVTVKKSSPREEVLAMARQGISSGVIASKLGKTIGEIELIISLGKREG